MTTIKNSNWITKMLLIAGAVEIVLGLLHFVMPMFANQSPNLGSLDKGETNFVTLCVFSVGILLVAMGCLTMVVSIKIKVWEGLLLPFLVVKSLLWCSRVGLELHFPVTIPLLYFHRPTTIVMPLLIAETLLFIIPTAYIWRRELL